MTSDLIGKIWNEDCLETMKRMEDKSVDLVVTDPPYAVPTVVAQGRDLTRNIGDFSIVEGYFLHWFRDIRRVLKDSGRAFVFCDSTSYPAIFRSSYGIFSSSLLVWDKGRIGMGREFRKSFELILHCWGCDTEIVSDGTGHPDVLRFSPESSVARVHPAQKPIDLVEYLVKRFPSDVTFDPFMGSGTTAVACEKLGRRWIGSEINPEYCKIAEKRIEAVKAQGNLFA